MSSLARSQANTFSSLSIERNSELRDDAAFIESRLHSADARFLILRSDGKALLGADGSALLAATSVQCGAALIPASTTYLGHAGAEWFALRVNDTDAERIATQCKGQFFDLRAAGLTLDAFDAGLFAYAKAIVNWQERTRFCSLCAAPLRLQSAGHRAKCTNPQCATEHFPRTDPAIIVIVSCNGKCLLGRQASWPARRYSTLAGFVEPGETLEDAVCREVFEEAGVHVVDCDYHSSQPWPFPASIMLGFSARADDATIRIGSELEDARWFSAAEIVDDLRSGQLLMPMPLSVSYRLIADWLRDTDGVELDALTQSDPLRHASQR